jgi:hypothetical protein
MRGLTKPTHTQPAPSRVKPVQGSSVTVRPTATTAASRGRRTTVTPCQPPPCIRTDTITGVTTPFTSRRTPEEEAPKLRPVKVTVPPVLGRVAGLTPVITGGAYDTSCVDGPVDWSMTVI